MCLRADGADRRPRPAGLRVSRRRGLACKKAASRPECTSRAGSGIAAAALPNGGPPPLRRRRLAEGWPRSAAFAPSLGSGHRRHGRRRKGGRLSVFCRHWKPGSRPALPLRMGCGAGGSAGGGCLQRERGGVEGRGAAGSWVGTPSAPEALTRARARECAARQALAGRDGGSGTWCLKSLRVA